MKELEALYYEELEYLRDRLLRQIDHEKEKIDEAKGSMPNSGNK